MKQPLLKSTSLITAPELAGIIGAELETVNNWVQRGIIRRTPLGGRQLRARLFSPDEVYKTALNSELVNLGIPPSPANEAVNALWKEWGKKDAPEGWKVYAVLAPTNGKWNVAWCSQKISGGPLYKLRKGRSSEEMDLPKKAFAVIPISDIFDRVTSKLSELLGEMKNQRG